jgi:peptidoglycan/xylan/chitin deacetylase (PgdA/CDA1 family)
LLTAALALATPLGCSGASNKGQGSTSDTGGAGDETGGSRGDGGSSATGGRATGGSVGSGGQGGSSDTGGAGGSTGGSGGSDTGGAAGGSDTGGTGGGGGTPPDAGRAKDSSAPDAMMTTSMGLSGNGCAGGTCLNPDCKPLNGAAAGGKTPSIGFELQPSYIPNDVIVPTFDDTPDGINNPPDPNFGAGDWTRKMVDYFDSVGMHVDFFINGNNFCDVAKTPECQETIRRVLKNHNPANHTVHHIHMGGTSTGTGADASCNGAACDAEMMGVETLINTLSMGGRPHLTRFRAPYGEPFQAGNAGAIAGIVGKWAVHVGWQMDSTDSLCDNCKYTGKQIAQKVIDQIGTGPGKGSSYGIVLMHGTYPWSYDAAKILYDPKTGYTQSHGFRLGTVEDVICWKYGKHSWELIAAANNSQRGPN